MGGRNGGRFEDVGLEDLSDEATNQGMSAATRSWKRQWMDSPQSLWEEASPCEQLDFSLLISVQEFWPPVF